MKQAPPPATDIPLAQDFTLRLLAHHGAVAQPSPDKGDHWTVALHQLGQHFGRPSIQIAFNPGAVGDDEDTFLAVPGSPLFERFAAWLSTKGASLWRAYHSTVKAPKAIPKQLTSDAKACRVLESRLGYGFDVEFAAQIAFVDEGRDERLKLCWSPSDGLPSLSDQSRVRALLPSLCPASPDASPDPDLLRHRLLSACTEIQHWAIEEASRREASLLERLSREVHRLTTYYGELMAQHEQEDILREQLAEDLKRRVTEELGHHRLGVVLRPLQYAVMARPQQVYTCKLGRAGDAPVIRWRLDLCTGLWFDAEGVAIPLT